MDDAEGVGHPIRVVAPTSDEEWRHAGVLIDELQEWDIQQSQSLGFVREEVLRVFYQEGWSLWHHFFCCFPRIAIFYFLMREGMAMGTRERLGSKLRLNAIGTHVLNPSTYPFQTTP